MRRDAKLERQLHRQPGTVGSGLSHGLLMGGWCWGDWERDGHERDEGRWGRDAGDGKASGSEACVKI